MSLETALKVTRERKKRKRDEARATFYERLLSERVCGTCQGTGMVGEASDQMEDCPDCDGEWIYGDAGEY